jgi:hypothetical protein
MFSKYKPQTKPLIAAIIPTYNEEINVAGVLEVLHATSILDEIILVDDGSSDGPTLPGDPARKERRKRTGYLHGLGNYLRSNTIVVGRRSQEPDACPHPGPA